MKSVMLSHASQTAKSIGSRGGEEGTEIFVESSCDMMA